MENFIHVFNSGGFVMYPLLILSLITLAIAVERFYYFRNNRKGSKTFFHGVYHAAAAKDWDVVRQLCSEFPSALSRVIANGMAHLAADADIVLVHDAARPLVSLAAIEAVISAAREKGAAIAAVRAKNTIKVVGEDGHVEATPARASLWEVQTPQGFRREILQRAYEKAAQDGFLGTDDASLVEQIGEAVFVVESDYGNLKITTPEDLWMAEALLAHSAGIVDEMKVTI